MNRVPQLQERQHAYGKCSSRTNLILPGQLNLAFLPLDKGVSDYNEPTIPIRPRPFKFLYFRSRCKSIVSESSQLLPPTYWVTLVSSYIRSKETGTTMTKPVLERLAALHIALPSTEKPYLCASWRKCCRKAALPAVFPAAQKALLGPHSLPLPLHQALALPQPLQVLLVLLELLAQLPTVPLQQLLLWLALPFTLLQPALLGLLFPLLLVTPAVPAPLVLLELVLELVDVDQLLTLLLQVAVLLLVLEGAASETGARGQALLLENQLVDLNVAVLNGQGGLPEQRGNKVKPSTLFALWVGTTSQQKEHKPVIIS